MDLCKRILFALLLVLGWPTAACAGGEVYSKTTLTEHGRSVTSEAWVHLRCAADLSCRVFAGPPAQVVEAVDSGKLTLSGEGGELCFGGECRMLDRCPAIVWTEEEKASGFAEAWEKKVLGKE